MLKSTINVKGENYFSMLRVPKNLHHSQPLKRTFNPQKNISLLFEKSSLASQLFRYYCINTFLSNDKLIITSTYEAWS